MWFVAAMLDSEDADPGEAREGILRPARKGRQTPLQVTLAWTLGTPERICEAQSSSLPPSVWAL